MFERIVIQQHDPFETERPIDVGALVEAMLFYGSVHLVADASAIKQLLRVWGPDGLLELVSSGYLNIVYRDNFAAIFTGKNGLGREHHDVVVGAITREQGGRSVAAAEEVIPKTFIEATGRPGRGRRLARRFIDRIEVEQIDTALPQRARADLLDQPFSEAAARSLLRHYAPTYPRAEFARFKVLPIVGDHVVVDTDIDFVAANAEYHQRIPPSHSSLSPAHFLSHLVNAREVTEYACMLDAELVTDTLHGSILSLRVNQLLNRAKHSRQVVDHFQGFSIDGARAIREAVNSGERGIDDILRLLERARRFRHWLEKLPPDADLASQYHRDSVADTWADKLPTKLTRWSLFTGVGAGLDALWGGGGTVAGIALSVVDTFFLDKLIRGWKPNQFVEGTVAPFVRRSI